MLPLKFENLGLLEGIFCLLEQELGYLNRKGNTNRHENYSECRQDSFVFLNKSWPIQGSCFVANVSHVSPKM